MHKKIGLLCGFLVLTTMLGAMELYVAPILYQGETPQGVPPQGVPPQGKPDVAKDLLQRLGKDRLPGGVTMHLIPGKGVETVTEAIQLSESQGYEYVLYGFVKQDQFSIYGELKLLERESKKLAKVFISADNQEQYGRLMDNLAWKILSYLSIELGLGRPLSVDEGRKHLWNLQAGLGYPVAIDANWLESYAGIINGRIGFRFQPEKRLTPWGLYLGFGADLSYQMGIEKPGRERFYIHGFGLAFMLDLGMDFGKGHQLELGLGPIGYFDMFVKERKYDSSQTVVYFSWGTAGVITYKYYITKDIAIGIVNQFEVGFYQPLRVMYTPGLFVTIVLASKAEESRQVPPESTNSTTGSTGSTQAEQTEESKTERSAETQNQEEPSP